MSYRKYITTTNSNESETIIGDWMSTTSQLHHFQLNSQLICADNSNTCDESDPIRPVHRVAKQMKHFIQITTLLL